jgi:ABC-type phosphate transport system auxiliary subunit
MEKLTRKTTDSTTIEAIEQAVVDNGKHSGKGVQLHDDTPNYDGKENGPDCCLSANVKSAAVRVKVLERENDMLRKDIKILTDQIERLQHAKGRLEINVKRLRVGRE